jgi:uncharacterized metal-binding protein YceD (DUF177 family)
MRAELWSVPVAVAEIPETGRQFDLVADATTRAAIASRAGVVAMPRLQASFHVTRQGQDGVRVAGTVSATVEQTCVVTLELMESEVEESVDLVFLPPQDAALSAVRAEEAAPLDEPPEVLQDGIVDLGAVATEFLILGIDPYPRKPGAVFTAPKAEESAADHPFAALAALKKAKPGSDGA